MTTGDSTSVRGCRLGTTAGRCIGRTAPGAGAAGGAAGAAGGAAGAAGAGAAPAGAGAGGRLATVLPLGKQGISIAWDWRCERVVGALSLSNLICSSTWKYA